MKKNTLEALGTGLFDSRIRKDKLIRTRTQTQKRNRSRTTLSVYTPQVSKTLLRAPRHLCEFFVKFGQPCFMRTKSGGHVQYGYACEFSLNTRRDKEIRHRKSRHELRKQRVANTAAALLALHRFAF